MAQFKVLVGMKEQSDDVFRFEEGVESWENSRDKQEARSQPLVK